MKLLLILFQFDVVILDFVQKNVFRNGGHVLYVDIRLASQYVYIMSRRKWHFICFCLKRTPAVHRKYNIIIFFFISIFIKQGKIMHSDRCYQIGIFFSFILFFRKSRYCYNSLKMISCITIMTKKWIFI
jgi:hypothetical protein